MRIVLTCLLLLSLFSARAQDEAQKIVKEYRRGEGPTYMNNGLGLLNSEIHYDKEGRTIKKIHFAGYGYKTYEVATSYYLESKPKTITTINYPIGFWPGTISLQSMSADHPNRKPDTMVQQLVYRDTLLLKTDYFRNGKLSSWAEYTYNEDGYEIELAVFSASQTNRQKLIKTTRDQNNRPIKNQEFNGDGSVEYTETITYNEGGLVKMKDYKSQFSNNYHVVTKFTYNSDGLLTKESNEVLSPKDRKDLSTALYNYDSNGLLIKEGSHDSLGKARWQKFHEYNSVGQKITTHLNNEFTFYYEYNQYGDLVAERFKDSRSKVQSTKRFIYNTGLLRKTEYYNLDELINYTQNYYSESGNLVREQPMSVEGQEALDWIKYFDYNAKNQLIRMNHKQPGNYLSHMATGIIEYNSKKNQPKPDPYKNYVNEYTYYTYDNEGRQVNVYGQGGEMTRITQIEEGKFCISQQNNDIFGMPSMSVQMIDRLDTVKIETRGELKIITLKLDYLESSHPQSFEPVPHYHKNLIREETINAKGELIRLKEITEDGILLYSSDENVTKSLSTHNRYTRSKAEQFRYGRYTFEPLSTTIFNANGLESLITNRAGDSTDFSYEGLQLKRKIKKFVSGYYVLISYEYDENGFKTMERTFKEDGTENYRLSYENDGKHIISEQHIYVHPNHETLFEITYLNP